MKLVLALTYDIDLEDWDIKYFNQVAKTFRKVFKYIVFDYNIYKTKNQKEYNRFKIPDFRLQYNNLK